MKFERKRKEVAACDVRSRSQAQHNPIAAWLKFASCFSFCVAVTLSSRALVWAQTVPPTEYQTVAPKMPRPNPPARVMAPNPTTPPPPPETAHAVVLERLNGLRIVASTEAVRPGGVDVVGVTIEDLPELENPEINSRLAAFVGRPVTVAALHDISAAIEHWYRDHDRPFVVVTIPEQNITSGTIQVVVSEFHVGAVHVTGNHWFSSDVIRRSFGIAPGQRLGQVELKQGIDFANANPFREVNAVLQKGAQPLTTDIYLQTKDRLPLRVFAGFENNGQPVTGVARWDLGFNWGNVLGQDQLLNYQFTTSDHLFDHPNFVSNSLDWVAPLPWHHHKLEVFGFYTQERPQFGPDIGQLGVSGQTSLRYIVPLPPLSWLSHEVRIGYDFKATNNNLTFGGLSVSDTTTHVSQFPLIYYLSETDRLGTTTFDNTIVWSPGGMTGQNTGAAFFAQTGTTLIKARYIYDRMSIERQTRLPRNMTWIMRVTGQVANNDLPLTEQLCAGGMESVRGYYQCIANATEGVLLSTEIRSPPFSLLRLVGRGDLGDEAQLDAFWDYGDVHYRGTPATLPNGGILQSVGVGARYAVSRYFSFHGELGFQLRPAPVTEKRGAFANIQLVLSY